MEQRISVSHQCPEGERFGVIIVIARLKACVEFMAQKRYRTALFTLRFGDTPFRSLAISQAGNKLIHFWPCNT
jgi:hypothetical protein